MKDTFKNYVKDKYYASDTGLLGYPQILQMIFALEWYDIPRTCYPDLIEFHPYLTNGDYENLFYLNY